MCETGSCDSWECLDPRVVRSRVNFSRWTRFWGPFRVLNCLEATKLVFCKHRTQRLYCGDTMTEKPPPTRTSRAWFSPHWEQPPSFLSLFLFSSKRDKVCLRCCFGKQSNEAEFGKTVAMQCRCTDIGWIRLEPWAGSPWVFSLLEAVLDTSKRETDLRNVFSVKSWL